MGDLVSNTTDIITDVIKREVGETGDAIVNDPSDGGGRTQFGISERSNPEAWKDGHVTEEEARAIYERKYVLGPGFDRVQNENLRAQLVDWGVNSGPSVAISKLQALLNVEVDGHLGPHTLAAIASCDPIGLNNHLMVERVKMIGRIVQKNPSQLKFLGGWLNRTCEFLI